MARLLILCDTFRPNVGGSEQVLLHLAREATKRGHQVTVFTPRSESPVEVEREFDRGEPYRIERSGIWRRLFNTGARSGKLTGRVARAAIVFYVLGRLLFRRGFDFIIAGHVLPLGSVAVALRRLRVIPALVMTYGEDVSVFSRGPRMRGMLAQVLGEADAVTCLTDDSAREIIEICPAAKDHVHVVRPPVDPGYAEVPEAEIDAVSKQHGLYNRRVMLSVGRLVPRKGFDVGLAAFSLVKEEFPDLLYVVVGKGPYEALLKDAARKLKVDERTIFVPDATPSAAPFYTLCDLFLMPNRTMPDGDREGFGLVFAEAGLARKPVIGGRSGGAVDAVADGETGFLVDPMDPNATAEAIRKLLKDKALAKRMGEAGREKALRELSPTAIAEQFEAIMDGVKELWDFEF